MNLLAFDASIHFPFVLSVARSAMYRRCERKTLMKLLAIRLHPQAGKSLVISTNGN